MLLAEHIVVWNQERPTMVTATGDVKLVDRGPATSISATISRSPTTCARGSCKQRLRRCCRTTPAWWRTRGGDKEGDVTTLNRGVYSPCELCKDDPSKPPTWQIKAVKVIHDTDLKRLYYHDATFQIDGLPVAWTPYFSTYDPSVKRASGILEVLPGYRSQLGGYLKGSYYFDVAPDIDAVLELAEFTHQGPLIGGQYRERFSSGQIQLSGSITESNIRQYPLDSPNPDAKTIRGHIFANGEFDLSENWRTGFEFARSEDNIYVLKYTFSSLQVLPSHLYVEGFYDRDYINASLYSFQDLRANIVPDQQPTALPYITYSFFGNPGDTLGGRWADSGSVLALQRFPRRKRRAFRQQRQLEPQADQRHRPGHDAECLRRNRLLLDSGSGARPGDR